MTTPSDAPAPAPAPSSPDVNAAASALPPECANCGAPLSSPYCGTCGQRAANRVVPLWQVSNELLEDLFDLDLRVLRTLPTFFFRPGRLTVEYIQGRRRRYIRPLRLYLFSSFLLFTVLALTNLGGASFSFAPFSGETQADVAAVRAELDSLRATLAAPAQRDTAAAPDDRRHSTGPPPQSVAASSLRAGALNGVGTAELRQVDEALAAVESLLASPAQTDDVAEAGPVPPAAAQSQPSPTTIVRLLRDPGALADKMLDRAPFLMFVLVPTFALLLKGLYLRRGRLYLEHLIFALHVHALAFIAFALSAGLGILGAGTSLHLDGWLAAAPFAYLFFAMRHVYGQSLLLTLGKMTILLAAYGIILAAAVVGLVVTTVSFL